MIIMFGIVSLESLGCESSVWCGVFASEFFLCWFCGVLRGGVLAVAWVFSFTVFVSLVVQFGVGMFYIGRCGVVVGSHFVFEWDDCGNHAVVVGGLEVSIDLRRNLRKIMSSS